MRAAATALDAPIALLLTAAEGEAPAIRESVGVDADLLAAVAGMLSLAAFGDAMDAGAGDAGGAAMGGVTVTSDGPPGGGAGGVLAGIAGALAATAVLAVPLPAADGMAGCLCVMDRLARDWSAGDEALLRELAAWSAATVTLQRDMAAGKREAEALRLSQLLSEGIARTRDVNSALLVILGHVCQRTGWDHGEAWIPDETGTRLTHSPTWFSLRSDMEQFAVASSALSFRRGEGLPGVAWETGEPLWVNDAVRNPAFQRGAEAARVGLSAAVAIPVFARGAIVAVLMFHSRALGREDRRFIALVANAGAHLGPILQRKTAEEALRRSESKLAGILHVTADAIISVDAGQRIRIFNTGAERMFGYTAAEMIGESLDVLLPESVREAHRAHMDGFATSGEPARWMNDRGEIAGRRRSGETFPAEATISRLGEGDDCLCTVVLRDVSERRRAERALADARARFESILYAAAEGIVGLDGDGRATFVNRAAAGLLGYEPGELVGGDFHGLVHHSHADGSPYPAAGCRALQVMRTGDPCTVDTELFWRKDGRPIPVQYTATPMHEDEPSRGAVLTFADIAARRAVEAALRELVVRDELTDLLNRRGFLAHAEQQLALCRRGGESCLLIYIDVDDFKSINDTHGHQTGDEALVEVALVLRDTFRQSDTVARLGGDEFVALAVHGGAEQEAAILDRLRRRVDAANAGPARRYTLAFSVGVARFGAGDDRSLEELMAAADDALYDQKRRRREMGLARGTAGAAIVAE